LEAYGLASKLEELSQELSKEALSNELSREGMQGAPEGHRRVDPNEGERLFVHELAKPAFEEKEEDEEEEEGVEEMGTVVAQGLQGQDANAEVLRLEKEGVGDGMCERQRLEGGDGQVESARGWIRLCVRRELYGWWAHCAGMPKP